MGVGMRTEGTSGLAYWALGTEEPDSLLILIHAVGANERQLTGLARMQGPRTLCALPRGPLDVGPNMHAWFEVRFGPSGPSIRADQAEDSRLRLARFVEALQAETGIVPARTVVAGFSQGGIMSAGLALTRPDRVAGFGLLAGRLLPEIAPEVGARKALAGLHAFVAHGSADTKLPVLWAERADAWLAELGVPTESRRYAADHELTEAMAADFTAWVARLLDGWA